jgi:REP element-mobilizing transposase RayT
MINPNIEEELYHYIIGYSEEINCQVIQINGVQDHIHILSRMSKTISVSEMVQEIKANSSRWIKTKNKSYADFAWQKGYGAFSVSSSSVNAVIEYIKRQKIHHEHVSFKEEFLTMLNKANIPYNEKYLWL